MFRFRDLFFTLGLALLVVYSAHALGQIASPVSGVVVDYFAPPPINRGLVGDPSRSPGSPESQIRTALRTARTPLERVGASGAPYVAGKLIVKLRDGTSSAARLSTLSATSAQASDRPPYANFDIVRIDPGRGRRSRGARAGRPARRRVRAGGLSLPHPCSEPNDPCIRCSGTCRSSTWNARGTFSRRRDRRSSSR